MGEKLRDYVGECSFIPGGEVFWTLRCWWRALDDYAAYDIESAPAYLLALEMSLGLGYFLVPRIWRCRKQVERYEKGIIIFHQDIVLWAIFMLETGVAQKFLAL